MYKYEVSVYTGSEENAATSATVYLDIHGKRGDTGMRKLLKTTQEMDGKFGLGQVLF